MKVSNIVSKLNYHVKKWRCFVDDTFVYVKHCSIEYILSILNLFHDNIKFTYEQGNNNRLHFHDILFIRGYEKTNTIFFKNNKIKVLRIIKICQNFSNSMIQNIFNSNIVFSSNIVSVTIWFQSISITTVLFHWNTELLVFSDILWQADNDFISWFTWPHLVSTQMHGYL